MGSDGPLIAGYPGYVPTYDDRFTPGLARMFRAVLAQLMRKLASSDVRYGGVLEGFRDVLAADATVIRLHRLLARRFSGTRTNCAPAAAKLHLVMSVRGTGAHKVKVTGERAKEHPDFERRDLPAYLLHEHGSRAAEFVLDLRAAEEFLGHRLTGSRRRFPLWPWSGK